MKTNEDGLSIKSKVYGTLTREQAIAILMSRTLKPTISLSNGTPKGGWTGEDRIK